jgi:Spy/CpxP family protein refolding chaperone
MKTRTFITYLAVAAGLLSATAFQAVAQPMGGMGGGRGGVLTQEQRTQINDAMQGSTEMTALNTKLAAAQKEALDAAMAKEAKDETVKAKLKAVSDIQAEIAFLRYSKGVKAVLPTLTEEQKTQINDGPGMAYNSIFGGGMGGMGRRGGAGGPPPAN